MHDQAGPRALGELVRVNPSSVAVEVAKALRSEILRRAPDDMFLGSEDHLVQRLGVSRPTFREAARLLEYEELLTIRRGVGGGYFGRLPTADVVARMAGIYLLAQGTTFEEVIRVQLPLEAAALQEISTHPDPAVRAQPLAFIDARPQLQRSHEVAEAVRAINAYWRFLADLVANRALLLFMRAAQSYGAKSAGGLTFNSTRVNIYAGFLRRISEAVLNGQAELAVQLNTELGGELIAWAREDGGR